MMPELSIAQAENDPIAAALKDPACLVRLWSAARAFLQRRSRELSPIQRTEEANVIVQEAILRALERRGRFDETRDAVKWLVGFVSNVAREFVKKRAGAMSGMPPDGSGLDGVAFDPSRPVDDIIADKLLVEQLMSHLDELDRRILVMNICDGKTCAEISQAIGMNENAVRMRAYRAKEKLKRIGRQTREGQP